MLSVARSQWRRILAVLVVAAVFSCGDDSGPTDPTTSASKLAFGVQPPNGTAGEELAPAVTVLIQDDDGNTISDATNAVTVALDANPGSGTLSGARTVNAVNGVATFGDLSIGEAANGYSLRATASGLAAATSSTFNIQPAAAARLVFTVQPSAATIGAAIAPAVEVSIQDALGNLVTSATNQVTIALGANPGGATLSGARTVNAVSGVATFDELKLDQVANGYTLTATASGLTGATSIAFNILSGQLAFSVQPSDAAAGAAISPAIQVEVRDQSGNLISGASNSVTVAIGDNPGGGTLSGAATVNAVNGVATFSDLSIEKAGVGYTLTATSADLVSATSEAFDIGGGAPFRLAYRIEPSDAAAGAAISPAIEVEIRDEFDNLVGTATDAVTLAIDSNPSGGTLTGTETQNAVNGIATFSDLSIDKAGPGYTLLASASGLSDATSAGFEITAAEPTQLGFSIQPSDAGAGIVIAPAVEVEVLDGFGNRVTTATDAVTVAIGTNPGSGALSGTKTANPVLGVATFDDLSIDKAGVGYTLTASASGLTGDTSDAFEITGGDATRLVFIVDPSDATAGELIAPAVQVQVQDGFGNPVGTATNSITLAIGTNPGGGNLSGTITKSASGGVATFSDLSIEKSGTGYTLVASATDLTDGESAGFDISAADATKLAFTAQPGESEVNLPIQPDVVVQVQDQFGNVVPGSTHLITISIGTNPGGGTLSGTDMENAVGGVAAFDSLVIDKRGNGYTLRATAAGISSATSASFDLVFFWNMVEGGNEHACGLTEGGALYCWGDNTFGQLGDGTNLDSNVPVRVAGGLLFTQVDAAETHTCALTADGDSYCWGDNTLGQLGDGTNTASNVPVQVAGGRTFAWINAANHGFHTCGVTVNNAAYCWGDNDFGQLGDNSTTPANTPQAVSGGISFDMVSGGLDHTCGVSSNGTGYCWGRNSARQLGNGTNTDSSVPVEISGGLVFAEIWAGRFHTCSMTTGSEAYCWGTNGDGQLGDGTNLQSGVPVLVADSHVWESTVVGANHSCGLETGGVGYCWGDNGDGRLGNGTTTSANIPTLISGGLLFSQIMGGRAHTCGVTTVGDAYCWGSNVDGQLGNGTNSRSLTPSKVNDPF
ncbi:MAG: hypothetical protein JSU87_18235 [Gemmatimonadota bacterium]|nr:MAG: hypothetical protein JSU87_18235 [Gemmatimonadota bacterium]